MRTKRLALVLLVAFATLAALASAALAGPGPRWPLPTTTTHTPTTMETLPGASYPWVQPVWVRVNGVVHVHAPRAICHTQREPAWIGG